MIRSQIKTIMSLIIFTILLIPTKAMANPFSDAPSMDDMITNWGNSINDSAPIVSSLFSSLFTIMFLVGVVRLGYSIVTKTGQVMKGATGVLIWAPISFFIIRIFLIVLFTINATNVTLFATDVTNLLQLSGFYTVVGMTLVGLVMFLFYKLLKHPEFGRWSKRLWASAGFLLIISFIIPYAFGAA